MKAILFFEGPYAFLSNFYPSEFFTIDGKLWPSSEHFYQAHKTLLFSEQEMLRNAKNPSHAKKLGSSIILRPDWQSIKDKVMLVALQLKFHQSMELREKLTLTHPCYLREGNNWHDNYWGQCNCTKCENIVSQNRLGYLLMMVRMELV
jgi:ribA/ribD-fused uncharacterized protein